MLKIRQQQYEILEHDQQEHYIERLLYFFSQTIPEALNHRSEDICRRIIRDSIQSGADLGITDDGVMARYVGLHFYLNGSLLDIPKAKSYLHATDLDPNTRVKVLCDQLEDYLNKQVR